MADRPEWSAMDALTARVHILESRLTERRPLVEDMAYRSLAQSSDAAWRMTSQMRSLCGEYQETVEELLAALEAVGGIGSRSRELRAIAHRLDERRRALDPR